MTNTFEQLKNELKVLYPDITEEELTKATKNLIDFFTIGTKIIQKVNKSNPIPKSNYVKSTYIPQ